MAQVPYPFQYGRVPGFAAAAILGSVVIVPDPVWSGLALALIFGMQASTALTLVEIPLFYYMVEKKNWEAV